MGKVTCGISTTLDGFVAGENMTLEKPFGDISAELLHRWMFSEREKHKAEAEALTSAGAFIMGRNMFGPKDTKPYGRRDNLSVRHHRDCFSVETSPGGGG